MGSLSQQAHGPPDAPRSKEELLIHAKDFINQYFTSFQMNKTRAHFHRLGEINDLIEKSGTYDLTMAELTFGAKHAWRNAPGCIGRSQWSKLQVFDAREIGTPREMFEALCSHIRYATNEGKIRSTITIFPQRKEGRPDFRVWNTQLISYAGYKLGDGKVIGDPANVEFTEMCVEMGWKPKHGMFDLLPLVLSAAENSPEYFELPTELVLEVTLKHPEYPWFAEMGLKWYALPTDSGMLLDCGGLEFPSCPFNGWFMGTMIGSRNLCDPHRYNMLEPIGLKMGLNTETASSLWKDRVLIEVNVAVLYSFESANVTIVNHHDASTDFISHMDKEIKLRGGCPSDWVRMVPPMSGSTLEVFHQEMLLYNLHPAFVRQDVKPWKKHVWKSDQSVPINSCNPKRKLGFKALARAVEFSASLMSKALSSRVKCSIFYATETGRSERFARRLSEIFKPVFHSRVVCMDDYAVETLEHESLVMVITSTFGNGEPPENGKQFAQSLLDMKRKYDCDLGFLESCSSISTCIKSSILTEGPLAADVIGDRQSLAMGTGPLCNVRFAVFGLGSKAYPYYAAYGKYIYLMLQELGAERLVNYCAGDALYGQEQSFRAWSEEVFKASCEAFCLDNRNDAPGPQTKGDCSKVRIVPVENCQEPDLCQVLRNIHGKEVMPLILAERIQLQAKDSDQQTILIKLDAHNATDLKYAPGDHVAIFPANSPEIVDAILVRLDTSKGPSPDQVVKTEISTQLGTNDTWRSHLPICTSRTAFSFLLDVTTPPSQEILQVLATQASSDMDKHKLEQLASNSEAYEKWRLDLSPNILEILDEFPSLKIPPSLLLTQLPLLQPRYYSISSSQQKNPNEVHATIAVVRFKTQDGDGPVHEGVCSSWLNRSPIGTVVPCFLRSAPHFHLPEDPSLPIIMIGPGSGIAPFRSFWQQRLGEIENTMPSCENTMLSCETTIPSCENSMPSCENTMPSCENTMPSCENTIPSCENTIPSCENTMPSCENTIPSWERTMQPCQIILPSQTKKHFGEMVLYTGCRTAKHMIYAAELEEMKRLGVLSNYHVALSREAALPKMYVQDIIIKNAAAVYEIVMKKGGHFYVSGDVSMAHDVTRALELVLCQQGGREASQQVMSLRDENLFHEDIFGSFVRKAGGQRSEDE
uniref:Nitric oxide synthase n=1 Tax=Lymnaea stagnalis TaxID=6523 RepID=NOS_LYMST|nr:RecName: Full=Nitric oxide synthase; AltName: Full=NOS type I; AltName: Full=Neuronal NOS; Short=N-NOS; Short=nNOS [Lymnaea stagnalis]AAC17487.1 nitric oxide synthase [Lymnaea stagnalis]